MPTNREPIGLHDSRLFACWTFRPACLGSSTFASILGMRGQSIRGNQSYDVEIWFSPEAAQVVTETVWHHTQKAKSNPDGSVTLTFQVDGLEEIANWILSWAGRAKIIQPLELRELILGKLRAAMKMQEE